MLVIHWAKHNNTSAILANGIRPSSAARRMGTRNPKGVYVYPYSRNKTLAGNWRRNLKNAVGRLGNYNGFIFRLEQEDFPLIAGYWFLNREHTEQCTVHSMEALSALYSDFFSGKILRPDTDGIPYNWTDFEIILPTHVAARRIMTVVKDREPRQAKGTRG